MEAQTALQCHGLSSRYGPLEVVRDLDLAVHRGEMVAMVGVNGAGKSSAVGTVAGVVQGTGSIWLDGHRIDNLPAHRRAVAGLALVPEDRGLFPEFSVLDTLRLGADRSGADIAAAYDLFPELADREAQLAGTLSGGQQQMLAIAAAVLAHPSVLIVDEPTQGLAPEVCKRIFAALRLLADRGTAVLLVEQNLAWTKTADRLVVMVGGTKIAEGGPELLDGQGDVLAQLLG